MKKMTLLLLALLLAATLCSCSSGKEEDDAPAAKSGKTAAQKAENKEPEIVEGAEYIQSREYPFRWCSSLTNLFIPNSVTSIGTGAFESCYTLTLTVNSGSYAHRYCEENGLQYTCPGALDWLYN